MPNTSLLKANIAKDWTLRPELSALTTIAQHVSGEDIDTLIVKV